VEHVRHRDDDAREEVSPGENKVTIAAGDRAMLDELLELFPDADFRHRMRFHSGTVAGFFGPTSEHSAVLAERRRWLDEEVATYAGATEAGGRLLVEAIELLIAAGVIDREIAFPQAPAAELAAMLGREVEPDFMVIEPAEGALRLVGGCICFPSSWSFAEKLGRPLEGIHAIVPELNDRIGPAIQAYLMRLPAGTVALRSNWGLSRSAERNQHPKRQTPRLDATVEPSEVWLRVEHQLLTRLPCTGGILFGIRLSNHGLAELRQVPELRRRMRRNLESMPEAVARYKNILAARPRLLELLG
jgi:hypothetical protein